MHTVITLLVLCYEGEDKTQVGRCWGTVEMMLKVVVAAFCNL